MNSKNPEQLLTQAFPKGEGPENSIEKEIPYTDPMKVPGQSLRLNILYNPMPMLRCPTCPGVTHRGKGMSCSNCLEKSIQVP